MKGLKSVIGVLPVAMTTIIVSPTARPNPIITALNSPALATGRTTVRTTCQRVAPSAMAAAFREGGTLLRASSAMVKITGITAKPIMKPTTRQLR